MVNNAPNAPQVNLDGLQLPTEYSDSEFNPLVDSAVSLSGSYYMDDPNASVGSVDSDMAETPDIPRVGWPERVSDIDEELALTDLQATDSGGYTDIFDHESIGTEDLGFVDPDVDGNEELEGLRSSVVPDTDKCPAPLDNATTSEPPPKGPDPTEPPINDPVVEESLNPVDAVDEVDAFGAYAETVKDPAGTPAFQPNSGSPGTGIIDQTLRWFSFTRSFLGGT